MKRELKEAKMKIQQRTNKNQDLVSRLAVAEATASSIRQRTGSAAKTAESKGPADNVVPPEWISILQSQTGYPPVLVILIALFAFLVGLLF